MRFSIFQDSRQGDRKGNEDRVGYSYSRDVLLMTLADGMGGHADGEVAAEIAITEITRRFQQEARNKLRKPSEFLVSAIQSAHRAIVSHAVANNMLECPRTTIVACIVQNGSAFWAHIGDSRVYLLRRGKVFKRTRDHSHVEFLMREGVITPDQAQSHPMRNFVECCLGGEPFLPEMTVGLREPLEANDILLVCSDGLWGGVEDGDIGGSFPPARAPLRDELQRLAERSVKVVGAGADNTSAAVVRWIGNA